MRIHVLYFAVLRERLALDGEDLDLAEGVTAGQAVNELAARHAIISTLLGRFRIAVNQDFVDGTHPLAEGDELVLIPPVAGGVGPVPRHVLLSADPLSLDRCLAAVTSEATGGVVTFTGAVRRQSRGLVIEHLEYEAYPSMAIREMTRLVDDIEQEIVGARVAVEHRVGHLEVGDIAVVIAAAAPHRAEAFKACQAMIDRLKDSVPIWKKEVATDGSEWVGLGP